MHEITTAEAAQLIGCGVETVRRLCRQGELDARPFGGSWVINAQHLDLKLTSGWRPRPRKKGENN